MVGCVTCGVNYYTGCAHTCKMRRMCVLSTALGLAAGALGIDRRVGESYVALV